MLDPVDSITQVTNTRLSFFIAEYLATPILAQAIVRGDVGNAFFAEETMLLARQY